VRDRQAGTTEIMSINSGGHGGNAASTFPSISADGRYVVFDSAASNLVAGDTNHRRDVFVHDRNLKTTVRVSLDRSGTEADSDCYGSMVSADGRFFGFESGADNLVSGDTNRVADIFLSGPFLTLEADPPDPPSGVTLTFMTWTGQPSGNALLAAVDVNGAPTFLPVDFGNFDGGGRWTVTATVPSGLSGLVVTFSTFGFVPTGKIEESNRAAVAFR